MSNLYREWYPSKANWAEGASIFVSEIDKISIFPFSIRVKSSNLFLTELISR